MRILFVTPFYYPEVKFGGPPKRLHSMAKELVSRGHEVNVVTFHSERNSSRDSVFEDGIPIQYVPWLGKSLRQVPRRLVELREAIDWAEVVHCFGLYNLLCPLAARLTARRGKPVLLEPMGMFIPRVAHVGIKEIYHSWFTRPMASVAAAIVATSSIEMDELRRLASPPKLVMRRNGLDIDSFRELPAGDAIRARWGIPAKSRLALYLGRISAKKNLLELTRAFCIAAVADARLVIAGPVSEPAYLRQVEAEIARSASRGMISLQPAVYGEELKAALNAADLFVLPSINENFGNSAAEAVAANVPVLLTETCGIAPIIHGRAGLAIPLGIEALSRGLVTMLSTEYRQNWMRAPEEVKRDLSWEQPIAEMIALYQQVAYAGDRQLAA